MKQTNLPGNVGCDFIRLYYCAADSFATTDGMDPERKAYVLSAVNENVRKQRAAVWSLLSFAFAHSLGLNISRMNFFFDNGKPECSECEFSLSHTDGYVAVAVSSRSVGVDVELLTTRFTEKLFNRITTENERKRMTYSPLRTAMLWTAKESIFKQAGKGVFAPKKIETSDRRTLTMTDDRLVLSVATEVNDLQTFFVQDYRACVRSLDVVWL